MTPLGSSWPPSLHFIFSPIHLAHHCQANLHKTVLMVVICSKTYSGFSVSLALVINSLFGFLSHSSDDSNFISQHSPTGFLTVHFLSCILLWFPTSCLCLCCFSSFVRTSLFFSVYPAFFSYIKLPSATLDNTGFPPNFLLPIKWAPTIQHLIVLHIFVLFPLLDCELLPECGLMFLNL